MMDSEMYPLYWTPSKEGTFHFWPFFFNLKMRKISK